MSLILPYEITEESLLWEVIIIKGVCENPTVFSGQSLDVFSLRQRYPFLLPLFKIVLEVVARVIRQENEVSYAY